MKSQTPLAITYLDFDDLRNPLLGAGQARATYEVASRLASFGHRVEVICSRYPKCQDRLEQGIKYTHIGLGTENIRLNNLAYLLILPWYVANLSSDVVVECMTPPVSTLFSPLFTKIPVVAIPTSFEAERFARKYHFPFHWVERFGLARYRYFLPTSSYFDQKMKRVNPKVVSKIVRQGVSEEYFRIKPRSGKYILFLGRFDIDQKGIDLLLQSFSRIADRTSYLLAFAGYGPDEGKLKKLVHELGMQKRVKFLGPVHGRRKHNVFAKARLFAVSSRHEAFCLAALEALAAGIPLVAFDIPGLTWIPKSVCLKTKPFDTDAFAKHMLAATHSSINDKLRKMTRAVAKQYSWDEVARGYEQFLRVMARESGKSSRVVIVATKPI